MGTRADFYVGRGESAEWIGSIAWDGYPEGVSRVVFRQTTEADYREAVAAFLAAREDATLPAHGWPWPWDDSQTTDYSYAFDGGVVWASNFGHQWWEARKQEPEYSSDAKTCVFPKMKTDAHARAGSKRSGVMVIGISK